MECSFKICGVVSCVFLITCMIIIIIIIVQQLDRQERKRMCSDSICAELGWNWKCVPLVVETFGAWGRTAGQFFSRLAAQGNSTKATMLNSIYGRLSLLLVQANARAFLARSIPGATTMDLPGG